MNTPNLEERVYREVCEGLSRAISERMNRGYADNPLNQMIDQVVQSRADRLRPMIEGALDSAFSKDFQECLSEAITHKLARVLISKVEGEIEKRANDLRTSPEFRAKLTLAIEKAIKECK